MISHSDNIPPGALRCHYVEQHELLKGMQSGSRFCEFYEPANYFYITARPDSYTLEGWLGRPDFQPVYFENSHSSLSFFQDYNHRKASCFTFDRTTLYRVVNILPEKPLKFILEQVRDFAKLYSMINQEEIYQLVHQRKWAPVLKILHQHKYRIAGDTLLQQAALVFEAEFQKDIEHHPDNEQAFIELLENLYLLHAGKFFILKPTTVRLVTLALAKRKTGTEALNYAREYPDDPVAQEIIARYRTTTFPTSEQLPPTLTQREWIEVYNRLFELINQKENSETYFSGPRFITAVQESVAYFPDYGQYITLRNESGKSTSRKIFYYDILMEQPEAVRMKIIQRILNQVRRKEPEKTAAIEMLLGLQIAKDNLIHQTKAEIPPEGTPVVFISYSWDDKEHSAWILQLAEVLADNGVEVILDQYDLKAGKNLPHFMEEAIRRADKVIIVFTPNYKLKAEGRKGGVGFEYSIMNMELYNNQTGNEKFIPVLRRGNQEESIPVFMQNFIHLDMLNDENFENSCTDLLREIYDEPAIKRPKLGTRPTFD